MRWIAKGVVGGHVDVAERDIIHADPRGFRRRLEASPILIAKCCNAGVV